MSKLAAAVALTALLATAGCVEPPVTGPVVLALPASGRTYEQFRADDAHCRTVAMTAIGGTASPGTASPGTANPGTAKRGPAGPAAQRNYDSVYAQCMVAAGDAVPSVGAPPFAYPAYPYAPPVYEGPTEFTR
ncbi:MAG: hypothetical protein J0I21_08370 [Alphaproteobacteria bacterium]|nr:hypothetical protein [Alphaproteobacteria bacterium]